MVHGACRRCRSLQQAVHDVMPTEKDIFEEFLSEAVRLFLSSTQLALSHAANPLVDLGWLVLCVAQAAAMSTADRLHAGWLSCPAHPRLDEVLIHMCIYIYIYLHDMCVCVFMLHEDLYACVNYINM